MENYEEIFGYIKDGNIEMVKELYKPGRFVNCVLLCCAIDNLQPKIIEYLTKDCEGFSNCFARKSMWYHAHKIGDESVIEQLKKVYASDYECTQLHRTDNHWHLIPIKLFIVAMQIDLEKVKQLNSEYVSKYRNYSSFELLNACLSGFNGEHEIFSILQECINNNLNEIFKEIYATAPTFTEEMVFWGSAALNQNTAILDIIINKGSTCRHFISRSLHKYVYENGLNKVAEYFYQFRDLRRWYPTPEITKNGVAVKPRRLKNGFHPYVRNQLEENQDA